MSEVSGEIVAEFAAHEGRTELIRKFHTSPLKIAKTFRYENEQLSADGKHLDQLGVYLMDSSPGLMSGDHYELSFHLQKGASVFLTNQSFTKVHPSMKQGSTQRQTIVVEEGALLEYMPEPLMLFKDSCYRGETEVRMEPGAVFMMSELLCPGRTQRGEKFHYKRYGNRLKIFNKEELIFYQNQVIVPETMNLQSPGSWEAETHLGSLYIFSNTIRQTHVDELLAALDEVNPFAENNPGGSSLVRYGASLTYKHGLVLSVMGLHAWQLQRVISLAWGIMRAILLSIAPLIVNK
jgi:urease accessory protein